MRCEFLTKNRWILLSVYGSVNFWQRMDGFYGIFFIHLWGMNFWQRTDEHYCMFFICLWECEFLTQNGWILWYVFHLFMVHVESMVTCNKCDILSQKVWQISYFCDLNVTFVTLTIDSSKVHVYSMNFCYWYIYLEFDGINYQKHDFYLAQFAYPGFNYVILWPQIQTNIKVQSQPLSHLITAKPITLS